MCPPAALIRLLLLFFLFSDFCRTALEGAEPLWLKGRDLAVAIQPADATLVAVENRLTGDTKNLRDVPFRLVTTRGEVSPREGRLLEAFEDRGTAAFTFAAKGLGVTVRYQIADEPSNAVRKFLTVTNEGPESVTLFRLVMFDWTIPGQWPKGYAHSYYPEGINQVHFHKSGMWYDHSINLFLRDEKGGLFLGVENPFFEAGYRSNRKVYPTRIEVSYRPNWILKPGETFESDPGFLGVYRQEGIFQAPPDPVFFGGRERRRSELLDWGETWAMQKYMRGIMASDRAPKVDDFIPTECWGFADPGRFGEIARRKAGGAVLTGEEQAMLAHFGRAFDSAPQEVWYRLTPDTVSFYKKAIDDAASLGHFRTLVIPNLMAGHKGWFESPEERNQRASVEAMLDTWYGRPAFPLWQELAEYAGQKGLRMFNFEIAAGVVRRDRPDWRYVTADGRPVGSYCYANREFAEWHAQQVDRALSTHPIGHWQWDEGWMDSFLYDVAGYLGDDAYCYADNHSHPPGNIRYHQFRNVMATLRTLKERRPDVRLVIISGLIPGMPWVMKHLNNDSHTGMMEYGAWGEHNIYFLPASKSRREGAVNWLVKGGSSGEEVSGHSNWYTMLEDPKRKAEWKSNWDRWMAWSNQNLAYLDVGRDLFGGPRAPDSLRGSAHFLQDRGYIFLHNPGKRAAAAEIPLHSWLGLETGQRYRVRQVHPLRQEYGIWRRGHSLRLPVGPQKTLLLQVEATDDPVKEQAVAIPSGTRVQKAFLTLGEVFRLLKAEDLWQAHPLPGKDKMPVF